MRSEAATILVEMRAHRLDTDEGRGRRRHPRYFRARASGGRARSHTAGGAGGQRVPRPTPGDRQPRIAHAAQCTHRLFGASRRQARAQVRASRANMAEMIHAHGPPHARNRQRPPRPLRHRGRRLRPRAGSGRILPNSSPRPAASCRLPPTGPEVALVQDVGPDLPELRADRRACQQILINLLSNAVKFTPPGGLVTVEARRDGERVAMIVKRYRHRRQRRRSASARQPVLPGVLGARPRHRGQRSRPFRGARSRRPAPGPDRHRKRARERHERHRQPADRGRRQVARQGARARPDV